MVRRKTEKSDFVLTGRELDDRSVPDGAQGGLPVVTAEAQPGRAIRLPILADRAYIRVIDN